MSAALMTLRRALARRRVYDPRDRPTPLRQLPLPLLPLALPLRPPRLSPRPWLLVLPWLLPLYADHPL